MRPSVPITAAVAPDAEITCATFWTLFTRPIGSAPSAPATPARRAARSRPRTAARPRRGARKRSAGALTRWQNHLMGLRLRAGWGWRGDRFIITEIRKERHRGCAGKAPWGSGRRIRRVIDPGADAQPFTRAWWNW